MPPGSTTSPTLRRLSLTKPVSSCPMRAGADSRPDGGWPRPGGLPAEGGRVSVLPSGRGADLEFRILGPLGVLEDGQQVVRHRTRALRARPADFARFIEEQRAPPGSTTLAPVDPPPTWGNSVIGSGGIRLIGLTRGRLLLLGRAAARPLPPLFHARRRRTFARETAQIRRARTRGMAFGRTCVCPTACSWLHPERTSRPTVQARSSICASRHTYTARSERSGATSSSRP
jgi:hypothetical protein